MEEEERTCQPSGLLPNDLGEQDAVGSVVVCGVVVTPELRPGEGEVPELVDETSHPLLLCLKPLVIAVPRLVGGREGEEGGEGGREGGVGEGRVGVKRKGKINSTLPAKCISR